VRVLPNPQYALDQSLQIEHIIARQHHGSDDSLNLALSWDRCNRKKGPNLSAIDSTTGVVVELFHPRRHAWQEHFEFHGAEIVGLTATGRATVGLLDMNTPYRLQFRANLMSLGQW
jgi:hypothetical protein